MAAKFVIKQTKTGFVFNLKATNGETIATSEVYTTEAACKNGIESVRKNAPVAAVEDQTAKDFTTEKNPKFEIYNDKAGKFRFRLKATNGQIIAVGEAYEALRNCKNGVESIKKNAPVAEIVKE
ncbi:MAG: DUF1508 domain-containing protein [Treponema sp.]|jgi:uncharacterized protein YegP (UPF0339 family)|nr:DUF1508 domain-containing protein [Treponema sp.]